MAGHNAPSWPKYDRDMTGETPSTLTDEEWVSLEERLSEKFGPEIAKLLRTQLDSTKAKWGFCKAHGLKVLVDKPDYPSIQKALEFIVSHLIGKPVEKKTISIEGKVVHSLEELTDHELEQIAEGEWSPKLLGS